jgi:hypothetical protein
MLLELDGYDWQNAFGYAGGANNNGITASIDPAFPTSKVDLSTFDRDDVVEIAYIDEGVRDECPWLIIGKLRDGRWFYIEAGCDYTGWDCQTSGKSLVADSKKTILTYGPGKRERKRFGLPDLAVYDVSMWGKDADFQPTEEGP